MNHIPTKPIRYEKNSPIYINGKSITLISFLGEKRKEKHITKKAISNIIKKNDYWYSQIEMGNKDDSRRKFINRFDLIDIISVIIFDAKNESDLERLHLNSENYIDNIIKVISFDQKPREIPIHELINKAGKLYSPEYTTTRIEDVLNDLNSVIRQFYNQCNPLEQDLIVDFLNTFILNISSEPILSLHYYGLPFCSFFSAQPKDTVNKNDYDKSVLNNLDALFMEYSKLLCTNDLKFLHKQLAYHLYRSDRMLNNLFTNAKNLTDE